MAKKSMVARDAKRARTAAKYANKRAELKRIINDRSASLEQVDNTGSAELVMNTDDLSAALLGSPIPEGTVLAAQITIESFDLNDDLIATSVIDLDVPGAPDTANPDLEETVFGLEVSLADVPGFAEAAGESSVVSLEVTLDGDEDGVGDLVLSTEIDVFGVA